MVLPSVAYLVLDSVFPSYFRLLLMAFPFYFIKIVLFSYHFISIPSTTAKAYEFFSISSNIFEKYI